MSIISLNLAQINNFLKACTIHLLQQSSQDKEKGQEEQQQQQQQDHGSN